MRCHASDGKKLDTPSLEESILNRQRALCEVDVDILYIISPTRCVYPPNTGEECWRCFISNIGSVCRPLLLLPVFGGTNGRVACTWCENAGDFLKQSDILFCRVFPVQFCAPLASSLCHAIPNIFNVRYSPNGVSFHGGEQPLYTSYKRVCQSWSMLHK